MQKTTGNERMDDADLRAAEELTAAYHKMTRELERVIIGQSDVLKQILIALFSRGHCLLEGVPGLAKTLMVSTVADLLSLKFSRIQFTPDLMPSDITGTEILETEEGTGHRRMKFVKGPIFGNILLGDEINRTPPKTQAALLQAMQEREVTVGQTTYSLPEPFFTIATQNPIEQEGTYPLPEAQLDRFMFNIKVDYPTLEDERLIVAMSTRGDKPDLTKVLTAERIIAWQKLVKKVEVPTFVNEFIVKLVRATRPKDPSAPEVIKRLVDWGGGPRAGIFLAQAGQAFAAMEGEPSVSLSHIKKAAIPVLRHRVSANFQAQAEGRTSDDIVVELLKIVSEPDPPKYIGKGRKT